MQYLVSVIDDKTNSAFGILEAPDLDALALAAGAPTACNRRLEVRPFL
jgi:hypothetical protein